MHWFSGITMATPINDIGWTYVILGLAIAFLVYLLIMLRRVW